jgi:pantoate kinase
MGHPFRAQNSKDFSDALGFIHKKITPYWPEANGGVERFMRTIGKTVKCAQLEGRPWRKELNKFLRNYRATPHRVTGEAPTHY